ncbi:MAG: hypothetical protein IMZ50_00200 [Candidatus Atribacteria bacterium]|nr:hypothetical protein [Candidatus Atribacteria bacterium]
MNIDIYRLILMGIADSMRSKIGCEGHREIIEACGRATTPADLDAVSDRLMDVFYGTDGTDGIDRLLADVRGAE